jgi:AcrR family transcriptional regulator
LFTEEGYEGTSIEQVLQASEVSRGALYHHFVSKEALFAAVLEEVEVNIAQQVSAAASEAATPLRVLRAGCAAWLTLARDPTIRQIVLIDAPSVVGWDTWREIDNRHVLGLLKTGLSRAALAGWGRADLVDTYAHMLLAVLIEVALLIARSEDGTDTIQTAQVAVEQFLNAIVGGESEEPRSSTC